MNHRATFSNDERPKGIQKVRSLPDPALAVLWESIILNDDLKNSAAVPGRVELQRAPQGRTQRDPAPRRDHAGRPAGHRQDVASSWAGPPGGELFRWG